MGQILHGCATTMHSKLKSDDVPIQYMNPRDFY